MPSKLGYPRVSRYLCGRHRAVSFGRGLAAPFESVRVTWPSGRVIRYSGCVPKSDGRRWISGRGVAAYCWLAGAVSTPHYSSPCNNV